MFTSLRDDGTAVKTEPFAEGWLTENCEYLGRPVQPQSDQDVADLAAFYAAIEVTVKLPK